MANNTNYKLSNVDLSNCLVTRDYFNSIYNSLTPSYKRNVLWAWGYLPASMNESGGNYQADDPYIVKPAVRCGMYPTSWKDFHLSSHSTFNNARLLDNQGKLFLWGCFTGLIWNANATTGGTSFTSPSGSNSTSLIENCSFYNSIVKLGSDHSQGQVSYITVSETSFGDYTYRAWGNNCFGQLGTDASLPTVTNVWPPITVACTCATTKSSLVCDTCIDVYSGHMISSGNLYYWGNNNNAASRRSRPVVVSSICGSANNVSDYCASRATVGVVLKDITGEINTNLLVLMGYNDKGQLGSSTTINRIGYTNTCFANTNPALCVRSFSLGVCSSFAVASNGTLWAWGDNTYGQLGTNRTVGTSCPIQSIDKNDNWRYVTTNSMGTAVAAIRNDGTLWVWGDVSNVQGSALESVRRSSPVQVGTKKNWVKVSIQGCRGDLASPNHMVGITEENI